MSPLRDGDDRVTMTGADRRTRGADAPHALPIGHALPGAPQGRPPWAMSRGGDRARCTARPVAAYGSDGSAP